VDAGRLTLRECLIDELALSPDGEFVCYGRRTVESGRDVRRLWLVPWSGGRPRALTAGPVEDHSPAFSPDGREVAFLSSRGGSGDQLHVIPVDGGEPERLTSFSHGVTSFAWRPDGRALAVTAADAERVLSDGGRNGAEPTARVVRRVDWRDDESGALRDRPTHIHEVPRRGGRPRRITSGPWFASSPRYLPDGRIAYLADPAPDADLNPNPQVHCDGAVLIEHPGPVTEFVVTADGAVVACAYGSVLPPDSDPILVYRDGLLITPGEDFWRGLAPDGSAAVSDAGGREVVHRIDGGSATPVVDPARAFSVDAIGAAAGRLVAVLAEGPEWADVHALEPGRSPRRLTRHGSAWLRRAEPIEQEERTIAGVHCWLMAPAGAATVPRATVLAVHGGPIWHWPPSVELGVQLLVRAGYRVVRPNIVGSYGFGTAWIDRLIGRWGEDDAAQCEAVLDALVDEGLADPARLGCFGRSYGGFVVNWLVGTSGRFAAAVSECGVANQVSAYAGSSCGAAYDRSAGLGEPLDQEGVDRLWRQSPLRHAAAIHTPLLLLQGEADPICPPSDAEQLFVALRMLRREVAYVLYPDGTHSFHRTARPDRRADRNRRLLEWFERWMPA
jgi:dipeptidyl aminopeptidase/acylaminoacyl peptidase